MLTCHSLVLLCNLVNHELNSSVLDCCFSADGSIVFSGGTDKKVRMWRGGAPPNGLAEKIGSHDAPVKSVRFLPRANLVASGGWDRKLKFWDIRSPSNPVRVVDLPERVYAMDVCEDLLVVATANRHILAYNMTGGMLREQYRKESSLKYQTRCITAFPDRKGFAVGAIDGRVGIDYFTEVPGRASFDFRCHRQGVNAYAVNGICFHKLGTFATYGSDGAVKFWDKDKKDRLKVFPTIGRPISCASFNANGSLFAYASSYDWSKGSTHHTPQTPDEIYIHYVLEDEIKPKTEKRF